MLGRGFYDSVGDIDFYQMSLSQSESPILHERIILLNTIYKIALESLAIRFLSDKVIHLYQIGLISNRLFVCGGFCGFSYNLRIFHSYGDITITGEKLQILTYARHLWQLNSKGSLVCHTYCNTRHPL